MGLLNKYRPKARKQFKSRPWLNKEDFPRSGELPATIIELRDAGNLPYSDVVLDVKCGKEEYSVGMKLDSVLLDQLVDELGKDDKKWRGKAIVFVLAKNQYINIKQKASSRLSKSGKDGAKPKRKK